MLGLFENPYVDTMAAANILQSAEHQALGYQAQLESIVMLSNDGTLPFAEVRIDAETGAARKTRIFVSGMEPKIASLYGEIVDDPTEADIAIMRVAAVSGGGGMGDGGSDIKFPAETMALISAVAGTGVPTVVHRHQQFPCGSAGGAVRTVCRNLCLFDVLDNAYLMWCLVVSIPWADCHLSFLPPWRQ